MRFALILARRDSGQGDEINTLKRKSVQCGASKFDIRYVLIETLEWKKVISELIIKGE